LWDNVKKPGRVRQDTTWRIRFQSWITRAANTHAKHVTRTDFPRQQQLCERASTLRLHVQSLSSLTANMEKKKFCTRILVAVNSGPLKQYCSRHKACLLLRPIWKKKFCTRILVAVNSGPLKQYCSRRTYVYSASENAPESTQQTWRKIGVIYSRRRRQVSQSGRPHCSNKLSNSGNAVCRNNTLHSVKLTRPRHQTLCVIGWIYHIVVLISNLKSPANEADLLKLSWNDAHCVKC
jgi:hypothetical protein